MSSKTLIRRMNAVFVIQNVTKVASFPKIPPVIDTSRMVKISYGMLKPVIMIIEEDL